MDEAREMVQRAAEEIRRLGGWEVPAICRRLRDSLLVLESRLQGREAADVHAIAYEAGVHADPRGPGDALSAYAMDVARMISGAADGTFVRPYPG